MADVLTQALGANNWQASLYSWGTTAAMLVFGLLLCGGLVYFLFIRRKTRRWGVIIWEPKEDGLLIPVGTDILDEKFFDKSKQVAYILRECKTEVFPPNHKTIYRKGGKDWCDYVRIQQEYIPVQKQIKYGLDKFDKAEYMYQLTQLIKQKPEEISSHYIYAPLVSAPAVKFDIQLMDHDINMMRMSSIDNRDKVYADRKDFMEKYGAAIGMSLLVVVVIVISYLSFDFIIKVQSSMISPMREIANGLA
jgi:hypothetical protein